MSSYLKYSFYALFSFINLFIYSQKVKIIDRETKAPIKGIYLLSEKKNVSGMTDSLGVVDISTFPKSGLIILQHPGYESLYLSNNQLLNNSLKIEMQPETLEIEEVVVAASKWEQDYNEIGMQVEKIIKKDISYGNPQTSSDLLGQSGRIYVQKSQLGGGSPTLRGFAANAILIAVDGIRMNNAIYRGGNLQNLINIDPMVVEKTEVLFGPGSLIYGSDALGGVMDFRTKQPKWSNGKIEINSNSLLRYSSAANERTGNLNLNVSLKRLAYFGSISKTLFGDLQAGSRRSKSYEGHFEREYYVGNVDGNDMLIPNEDKDLQIHSGFSTVSTLQKLRYRVSSLSEATYSFYLSRTSDIPRYDRLTQPNEDAGSDDLNNAEWYYGPQKWQMHAVNFKSYKPIALFENYQINVSNQGYEESRNVREFDETTRLRQQENVGIWTFSIDCEKEIAEHTLYYGLDGFENKISSRAQTYHLRSEIVENEPDKTRYPVNGSRFRNYAGYFNFYYRLSSKIILNAGGRYTYARLFTKSLSENIGDADLDELITQIYRHRELINAMDVYQPAITEGTASDFFDQFDLKNSAFTGSIGSVFNKSNNTKLSFILSTGFRAPNLDDVGKVFEISDNIIVIPNTDLKPEYTFNQEVSLDQQFGNSKISFNLYHSLQTNAIVRGEATYEGGSTHLWDGGLVTLRSQVNSPKAVRYGGSLAIDTQFSKYWTTTHSFNMNEGKETETNQYVRHVTPLFGQSGITYSNKKLKSSLELVYNGNRPSHKIRSSEIEDKAYLYTDEGSPGWMVLNWRYEYILPKTAVLQGGVENIFDQHYRTYSSGISAPGRNIYLALRMSI